MSNEQLDEVRRATLGEVDRIADQLAAVSHLIHGFAELQFEERRSADALTQLATSTTRKLSTVVEPGGLPTAFRFTVDGTGEGPHVAFIGEYDALPEIGHGCGHNIIGTAAVGAFLALASVADRVPGKVSVIGTPAEEGGGGKAIMVNEGIFDDVDAAFIMHPSWGTYICPRLLGMSSVPMTFSGLSSHAGQSPFEGFSALNGVIQTFNSLDTMRHHMHPNARMHGVVTEGGSKPSVIPDRAACHFYVRAPELDYLETLVGRVEDAARGAAMATQTTVTIEEPEFPTYEPYVANPVLNELFATNAVALGEQLVDLGKPFVSASNDIGNVSRRLPVSMMMFGITDGKHVPHHSREFERFAITPSADRALVVSSKAMAASAAELLLQPGRLADARSAFDPGSSVSA